MTDTHIFFSIYLKHRQFLFWKKNYCEHKLEKTLQQCSLPGISNFIPKAFFDRKLFSIRNMNKIFKNINIVITSKHLGSFSILRIEYCPNFKTSTFYFYI